MVCYLNLALPGFFHPCVQMQGNPDFRNNSSKIYLQIETVKRLWGHRWPVTLYPSYKVLYIQLIVSSYKVLKCSKKVFSHYSRPKQIFTKEHMSQSVFSPLPTWSRCFTQSPLSKKFNSFFSERHTSRSFPAWPDSEFFSKLSSLFERSKFQFSNQRPTLVFLITFLLSWSVQLPECQPSRTQAIPGSQPVITLGPKPVVVCLSMLLFL